MHPPFIHLLSSPSPWRKKGKQPNPYIVAPLTATLAGLCSVVGSYFVARFQAQHAIAQIRLEYRTAAYNSFLHKTNPSWTPVTAEILNIGTMADKVATDLEIQEFEDHIAAFLRRYSALDLYWRLNADLNVLRLHGSERVSNICSDILLSLTQRDDEINWSTSPPDVVTYHDRWKGLQQNGIAYGWEERVSGDERLMIVMVAKLTEALIQQLRLEIHGSRV